MSKFVSHAGERERYAAVIDDFIGWSLKHPKAVQHSPEYEQPGVAFKRTSDGAVLWSADPRRSDGAKFELLPGKHTFREEALCADVLAVMQPFSETPLEAKSKLTAPFLSLKRAETRKTMLGLLDRLIAD